MPTDIKPSRTPTSVLGCGTPLASRTSKPLTLM